MSEKSKFLRGQLLLDAGDLSGSFFARSVVLICQHDADGAFGLIVNRAAAQKFGQVIPRDMPGAIKEQPLFIGGPVQPTAMSYLHSDAFLPDANVIEGLSVGHSLEELLEIGGDFSPTRKLKTFAGYTGWASGQLENEMTRKAWIAHPATLDLVFDSEPEKLWQRILRTKGWRNRLIAEIPEDPSQN